MSTPWIPAGKGILSESIECQLIVHSPPSLPPSLYPPPSLLASLPLSPSLSPCLPPLLTLLPFISTLLLCSWSCSETYSGATSSAMDWHRYMKQRHRQVIIRSSKHDFVACHMVVCVFTVLVGTSHILFWNTISTLYMSQWDCGAKLTFLSTFRYFAKLAPIQDYCW